MGSCEQVLIIFTKGESASSLESVKAATLLRSNGVKIITVYVGGQSSTGYNEHRSLVTDVGELAGLRIDRVDLLTNQNETDQLQRAADIPAPITGQLTFCNFQSRSWTFFYRIFEKIQTNFTKE